MKETFIATSGMPGNKDFTAMMFTMESDTAHSPHALKDLARLAAKKYAMTEEGAASYSGNCGNFNWGDLVDSANSEVFKHICDGLGLRITWLETTASKELWIDHDEELMDNIQVTVTDVEWDTDGEPADDLPTETTLQLEDPGVDIADALSDKYGFCVKSYRVKEAGGDE